MRKILLTVCLLLLIALSKIDAQSFQWVRGESYSSYVEWDNFVVTDHSNNIIIAGKCDDGMYIIKYNSDGNKLWERHFIDSVGAKVDGIACDENNNIYVLFFYMKITIDSTYYYNQSSLRGMFLKLTPQGATLWLKLTRGLATLASKTDNQNNLLINGVFSDTLVLDNYTLISPPSVSSSLIAKFNTSGQCVLAIQDNGGFYPYPMTMDALDNMYEASYFAADTFTIGHGIHQITLYRANGGNYVAKYNTNGDLLWAKQFRRWAIAPDDYGNLYTLQQDTADSFYSQLTKYDANGNLLWKRTIIHPNDIYHINLKFNKDNLYLSGGFRNSISIGDSAYSDNGTTRMFIAKLDTTGQLLWFNKSAGTGNAGGKDLAFGPPNEIYVTGDIGEGQSTFDTCSYSVNLGIFLTKITDNTITTGIKLIKSNSSLYIYPNPSHTTFYLTLSNTIQEPITINIFSPQGQLIYSETVNDIAGSHKITLNALPGVYYLRAEGKKESFVEKLVVY
jgi:hypothetical protein